MLKIERKELIKMNKPPAAVKSLSNAFLKNQLGSLSNNSLERINQIFHTSKADNTFKCSLDNAF